MRNNIFLFLLSFFCFQLSQAQTSTSSPYSRYGLGDLQYSGFANVNAMGGVSYAFQNDSLAPYYINVCNPASHANYRLTAFDVGVMDQFTQLQTSSQKFNTNRAALSYLAFAFPITKWWGGSFGMLPFSSVGYKVNTSSDADTNLGTVHYAYQGDGGLNEIYLANSFKIKDLSLGIHVSYLFGELMEESRDSFPDITNSFSTRVTETRQFNDVYFKTGLQYKLKLKNNWSAVFGLTANLQTTLNARYTYLAETYKYRFNIDQVRDTISYLPDVKENVLLPGMYGFGIVLRKSDKLLVTADVSTQNWSKFDSFGQKGILGNSNRVSAGFQYWPERSSVKGAYYKRVAYRAGFRYSNTMLQLDNNTPINDMAVTFGFGLPLRVTKVGENYNQAMLNLSFELGQRGTTNNSLIMERYARVVLGFSINEKWFIQRKYD
jgi:hypothetical protein